MDPIVQRVEMAEALLGQFELSVQAVRRAHAWGAPGMHLDQQAQLGNAEQAYPEVWRCLDEARTLGGQRGRDLAFYDQIRLYVGDRVHDGLQSKARETSVTVVGVVPAMARQSLDVEADEGAVRAARDAIHTFRTVFPDLAWKTQNEPVPELRTHRGLSKALAIVGFVLSLAVVLGVVAFLRL